MTSSKFSDVSLDLELIIISCVKLLDLGLANAVVRVSGFLARDNPGIPHVRDVTVNFHQHPVRNANELTAEPRLANSVARMLLDSLPSNSLEAFRWALTMC